MKTNLLAVLIGTSMAVSAMAQSGIYNWTVTLDPSNTTAGYPGDGSGTFTIGPKTGSVYPATQMTGTLGGQSVTIKNGAFFPSFAAGPFSSPDYFGIEFILGNGRDFTFSAIKDGSGPWSNKSLYESLPVFPYGKTYKANVSISIASTPEPQEYAAVAGIGMIGFGLWRRFGPKSTKA
jgi:hypothetical protein